jgi:hypothetical protein
MKKRYQSFKGPTTPNSQVLYFVNIKNGRIFYYKGGDHITFIVYPPVMFTSPDPKAAPLIEENRIKSA